MKTINIRIETDDKNLINHLMETPSVSLGQQKSIPGGAVVTFQGGDLSPTLVDAEIINLAISFGTGVAASLVATWLYTKLNGRTKDVKINKKRVEIERGEEILRVTIEEENIQS